MPGCNIALFLTSLIFNSTSIHQLQVEFVALEKQVKDLKENVSKPAIGVSSSTKHATSVPDMDAPTNIKLSSQIYNLTKTVKKIADFLLKHQKKFFKMVSST